MNQKFIMRKIAILSSFHTFVFVAVSQASLGYAMGVNHKIEGCFRQKG
ncbi:hypothetical protein QA584_04800 [Anaerocolumna sp. AGMB13025]|nr:hypothetical protein [Anaerocolumna sp. AGMB13025]WFR58392.1 hypothetical protein QA584_04800 [Anaerocolumna sp. AGMB13025]